VTALGRQSLAVQADVATRADRLGFDSVWVSDHFFASLERLDAHAGTGAFDSPTPWDRLYRWAEQTLSVEGQEMLVSLLIEPHGALVDDLAETMAIEPRPLFVSYQ